MSAHTDHGPAFEWAMERMEQEARERRVATFNAWLAGFEDGASYGQRSLGIKRIEHDHPPAA